MVIITFFQSSITFFNCTFLFVYNHFFFCTQLYGIKYFLSNTNNLHNNEEVTPYFPELRIQFWGGNLAFSQPYQQGDQIRSKYIPISNLFLASDRSFLLIFGAFLS